MTDAANPYGIRMIVDADGNEEAYIPLRHISEDEVERLRAEKLDASTPENLEKATAPPGIKDDVAERSQALMEEAFDNAITEAPASPADALG